MDHIRLRKFSTYEYADPRTFLIALREFELKIAEYEMPDRVRRLRTNKLKPEREKRDAAIFCIGINQKFGINVRMAAVEDQDYDFVTTWIADGIQHYCTVQLKEVAPDDLRPTSSIYDILNSLSKYSSAQDLTVAIKLSGMLSFDPNSIAIPPNLKLGGLFIFSGIAEDQSQFAIWGDFMSVVAERFGTIYAYPTAAD
jgi:hypothetical protein